MSKKRNDSRKKNIHAVTLQVITEYRREGWREDHDIYGFLNKISEKWEKLSKKDKRRVAKMIAGSKSAAELSSSMDDL